MPLPLPNLDTRRWNDLIEEGRALIPRYASEWTDHNVHDPGVMLMELFAYLVEQDIFQLNQVPERHKLKFLNLIGFNPLPPTASHTVLAFTAQAGAPSHALPVGVLVGAADGQAFQLKQAVTVVDLGLASLFVDDGADKVQDRTPLLREGLPLRLFGDDPMVSGLPAFYLAFDRPMPIEETVSLWFSLDGDGRLDRGAIMEQQTLLENCIPKRPGWPCGPVGGRSEASKILPSHYSVRLEWAVFDGSDWRELDPRQGEVFDSTYGMTVSGLVQFKLSQTPIPVDIGTGAVGNYLRCRMVAGPPDAAPVLQSVVLNAALVAQSNPAKAKYSVASGVSTPVGLEPLVGQRQRLHFTYGSDGTFSSLQRANDDDESVPDVLVSAYSAALPLEPGEITMDLVMVGRGTGAPEQHFTLLNAPVDGGWVNLWTLEGDQFTPWQQQFDLDASKREDAHFMLDAMTGQLVFGNGLRGRVVPDGVPIFAQFSRTRAAAGNGTGARDWSLAGVDDEYNSALIGDDVITIASDFAKIEAISASWGGADAESTAHAAGRAAVTLWAHERLVELGEDEGRITLDQMPRDRVNALKVPDRALTLFDYERLALEIPGTQIARARAWSGLDPHYPCLDAVGTVTLVIVPELPVGAPAPTPGLIDYVGRFFAQRKVLGTRLVVTGPGYVTARVKVQVQVRVGQATVTVEADIHAALDAFFDPLTGGPEGRGWPFGRDVYRTEILQVIDNLPGVDYVLRLELMSGDSDAQCGNLCVGPTALVLSGNHTVEAVS